MENKIIASEYVDKGMLEYSKETIYNRAIPDLRDGLKPINRYILWAMYVNNINKLTKSANVVGEVFKYSPHGDSYESLVNMVTKNKQHLRFIEGKGNFADATSDLAYASSRYTECKLSKQSDILLSEIKNGGVDFVKNYDNTKDVPLVLPTTAPNILFNLIKGMSVGFAVDILPMNTKEIYSILKAKLNNKKYNKVYPDFPNGCYVIENKEELNKLYETGKAKFTLSSKYHIKGNSIFITSIPEVVKREKVIEEIKDLARQKIVPEIKQVVDNSGLHGFEIEIVTKREPENVIKILLQKTSLTKNINANMNIIVDDNIMLLGIDEILDRWIEWRKEVIKRELDTYLNKVNKEMDKLETILSVKKNKDEVIPIIMNSKNVEKDLSKWYNEEQIKLILSMKLQQLTKDDEKKIKSKLNDLQNLISEIASVKINDLILKAYKETVPMLKRKSEIIKPLKKVKIKQPKAKKFKFDFKNGFIVKGDKELQENERFVILTKENTLYTLGASDLKEKLFVTDEEVLYTNIVSENSNKEIVVLFDDEQIVKFEEKELFLKRKCIKDVLHGNIKEINPEYIDADKLPLKKSRKSKGCKLTKKLLK